jgi:two-component system OmpR family sensor kinase
MTMTSATSPMTTSSMTTSSMTMTDTVTETTADTSTPTVAEPTDTRDWRPRIGIRTRVVVGYVALLAASLAISALVTRQVLHARLEREIDSALAQEVEEIRLLAEGTDPATGEAFGDDVEAILRTFLLRSVPADDEAFYTLLSGEPFQYSFDAPPELFDDDTLVTRWAASADPRQTAQSTAVGDVRWLAVPLTDGTDVLGTFVVVAFPENEREAIAQNLRIVLIAGGIVLVASAALAWSLAGRVLRPVRELTATAHAISDSDLSARIPVEGNDELAELGRTFNAMLDRLEAGFDGQRRFLDDVAHELRTPITIAQGHLELLGDDPDERRETTEIITDELDRMSRYVSDLLLLAKAERADFLHLSPVDIAEFLATVLRTITPLADRDWQIDRTPPPGRTAIVDQRRLSQAVLNLASNAVDHTATGDTIALGASIDDGKGAELRLWVRDTGSGVDPAIVATLFDRHARGATSRTVRPEGMGIGLSIVDAIARAHRGTVDVESEPGAGTRFEITIPLLDPPATPDVALTPPLHDRGAT